VSRNVWGNFRIPVTLLKILWFIEPFKIPVSQMYHCGAGCPYEEGSVCGKDGVYWNTLYSAQFCCKPKAPLKKNF
jgi:hypothetical protein